MNSDSFDWVYLFCFCLFILVVVSLEFLTRSYGKAVPKEVQLAYGIDTGCHRNFFSKGDMLLWAGVLVFTEVSRKVPQTWESFIVTLGFGMILFVVGTGTSWTLKVLRTSNGLHQTFKRYLQCGLASRLLAIVLFGGLYYSRLTR
ncbi:hypothetical protein BH11VER1_BH11VER1_41580 [soil metagenome]